MTNNIITRILVSIAALATAGAAIAADVKIHVITADDKQVVELATVSLTGSNNKSYNKVTDADGVAIFKVPDGQYSLHVSYVGYSPIELKNVDLKGKQDLVYKLINTATLNEVVVTASEGKSASSASVINRDAMEHLQPSSFTDLTSLLPGGKAQDPEMGQANLLRLREASNSSSSENYDAASLGAAFVVDGVPISTNAEMQTSLTGDRTERETVGKGVDMRTISTDDIESVEIVRGIASAEYGEVTSGVVNIKRKRKASPLEARFKADMQSQLFYVGKGFHMPGDNWIMNVSLDFLNSRIDPRNTRENFKRVGGSLRSSKEWTLPTSTLLWSSSLNYSGTFERDKNDPDLTVNNTKDFYSSQKHSFSWDNSVVHTNSGDGFYRSASFTAGLSYAHETINQEKTIASTRIYPMPISTEAGEHYVDFLPMLYESELLVDGKPFTFFSKLNSNFKYPIGRAIDNRLSVGVEWATDKNYGRGQVYDLMRPIVAGNTSRPRAFSDIPAMNRLSAYVENVSTVSLGENTLYLSLGLRETQLMGLDKAYYLHNRPYLDPRVNLKWTLPTFNTSGHPFTVELAGGVGQHTKMPVSAYLFPDKYYSDFIQLNYFPDNKDMRVVNVKTYVEDLTNYDLKAARNFKWEVRMDLSYRENRLSVTYFRERMNDGFRRLGQIHTYQYNFYDVGGYDASTGVPPTIDVLPYHVEERIANRSYVMNASKSLKQGIEYTFTTRRFPVIRTRLTVNGAWFRTSLLNSMPQWLKPSAVVNGKELQVAGLYDDPDGNKFESVNTNFMFDTDIPRLGLRFSLAIQNLWFTNQQSYYKAGIPTHYVGVDGVVKPYTEADQEDVYLRHLVRNYSSTAFDNRHIPSVTDFNIKATKRLLNDKITLALYVNRLFSIAPDYYMYGKLQRRYSSPYFGMELNLKL